MIQKKPNPLLKCLRPGSHLIHLIASSLRKLKIPTGVGTKLSRSSRKNLLNKYWSIYESGNRPPVISQTDKLNLAQIIDKKLATAGSYEKKALINFMSFMLNEKEMKLKAPLELTPEDYKEALRNMKNGF